MTELERLTARMSGLDLALFEAQQSGDIDQQITLLTERAGVWRAYSALLERAGEDGSGAILAAHRDMINAAALRSEGNIT